MNCIVKVGLGRVGYGDSSFLLRAGKQKLGFGKLIGAELSTVQTKFALVRFYHIIPLKVQ